MEIKLSRVKQIRLFAWFMRIISKLNTQLIVINP